MYLSVSTFTSMDLSRLRKLSKSIVIDAERFFRAESLEALVGGYSDSWM